MKALLIKSSIKINLVFTNYHLIKKNLLEIMEKLEKYSKGLPQIEKDFAYLLNPSYFPQAYQASIIEIKRRIIFLNNEYFISIISYWNIMDNYILFKFKFNLITKKQI